jgi:hypothetical protein
MEENQMEETTQMEEETQKSNNATGIDGIDETSKKILVASGIIFNSEEYPEEILLKKLRG